MASEYFVLEGVKLGGAGKLHQAESHGKNFQIVTVTTGEVELSSGGETLRLGIFQTALVSEAAGSYSLKALGGAAAVLLAGL